MKITADVKVNFQKMGQTFEHRRALAQKRLAAIILADSNKFVPMDTGMMKRSSEITSNNTIIRWVTRYAQKVWEYPQSIIKNRVNPNARSKWFLHAQALQKKHWQKLVDDTMKGKI